ncbi:MAG: 3-dehydroquinate synthase family protein [Nocardioides sp.]
MPELSRIAVAGPSPYEVLVGQGLMGEVATQLAAWSTPPQRVALVLDGALSALAEPLRAALAESFQLLEIVLPSGEAAKTTAAVHEAWGQLGSAGFTRSDAVVTFGGGATTDVGGFIAATWLRGVPVLHVPTTVLGMVDAAVGGKTGINSGAGKNLVGAFHEPAGVICDLDLIAGLPVAEVASGLAEAVKCGFIADPEILPLAARLPPLADAVGSPTLRSVIERAIAVKAAVVAGDLRETHGASLGGSAGHPGREVLNYGHTLAHAIERHEDYGIRHGEAVAIGCVFVAEVAARVGLIDTALVQRHREAFGALGLPIGYRGADFETLRATMAVDKKSRGATLRLVVLRGLADPTILAGPAESVLSEAYAALARERWGDG